MGGRFFDPEVGIWRFFGRVGDIVVLSLLWVLFALPVVTAGASSTALYDAAAHCIRRGEGNLLQRFTGTFRRELKTGCLTTLLWGAAAAALYFFYRGIVARSPDGQVAAAFSAAVLVLAYCILGVLSWVFPLLSRFTFGFLQLQRTALMIAPGNILRTALMVLMLGGAITLFRYNMMSVFFTPGLAAWLSSCLIEPVFEKYEN